MLLSYDINQLRQDNEVAEVIYVIMPKVINYLLRDVNYYLYIKLM
ncbi:hypothetical protein ymoll0001_27140 [Yersinia mollaretii ATCC 43969]|uniref:Uncharacterized protein n=1 Tax=Yersinia mollaretii (strain ATCC 43969 / DSM 18520 / CIP 103324 / CNY 7263 / WAIP 204) TaxID=349967 RepID=A0ABM9Y6C0_YERMW|nr:hypothetical protein ymoll0001_27140 [Yersinia mollaretii ATCC 43969]